MLCFCPILSFGQLVASYEEINKIAQSFSQRYLNQNEANVTFVSYPTFSRPLYEVSINDYTLIISSEKFTPPVLMVIKNDRQSPVLNNPNLPEGMQYFIEKYCWQIKYATDSLRDKEVHSQWTELLNEDFLVAETTNRNVIGPLLTTIWKQSSANGENDCNAYNYYVPKTDASCNCSSHQCPTGCVATAMAQIMKYWNYPVFRYGHKIQYDWCNMSDSLSRWILAESGFYIQNDNYEIQRNAIARLMADCGEAANMHYCCDGLPFSCGCQSFAWPVDARNALVDSFQYSPNAIRLLRSDYLTQPETWKNFLIQDLQNGRPLIYAGASYAVSGYEQSGHAFVCDGYDEDYGVFHFNWGWGSYLNVWCVLDAIIVDNCNYSHLERAVFHIYPSTNENYCNFDLELWLHYALYYLTHTTPLPYNNVPQIATRLFSSPIYAGSTYLDPSWRTIPSGATSEYVAHKEVVLQPGFTAASGSNFTARIEPCEECENGRRPNLQGERNARRDAINRVSTTENDKIKLYPNPAHNTLTVESANPIREITVYDQTGRAVAVETRCTTSPQRILNITSLHAGIYLVKVVSDNGTETAKFVKD